MPPREHQDSAQTRDSSNIDLLLQLSMRRQLKVFSVTISSTNTQCLLLGSREEIKGPRSPTCLTCKDG
jgi:hypothetical protein